METYWDSSWFNKYLTKEGAVPFFAMKMTCWAIIDCVQVVCDCETIRHRSQSTTLQHRFDGWEGQFYLSWAKFTSNLKIASRSTTQYRKSEPFLILGGQEGVVAILLCGRCRGVNIDWIPKPFVELQTSCRFLCVCSSNQEWNRLLSSQNSYVAFPTSAGT